MQFFQEVTPDINPHSLLEEFARAVNNLINEEELVIMNGPNINEYAHHIETREQHEILANNLEIIQTNHGPIYTTASYEDNIKSQSIKLATTSEIKAYFIDLGNITISRKKCTCIGLCSAVLIFAESLKQQAKYEDIEIELCQLKNWGHVFIKFKHPNAVDNLYFDPWFQKYTGLAVDKLYLYKEECFKLKMGFAIFKCSKAIKLHKFYLQYDPNLQKLNTKHEYNLDLSLVYRVVCSSNINHQSLEQQFTQIPQTDINSDLCRVS